MDTFFPESHAAPKKHMNIIALIASERWKRKAVAIDAPATARAQGEKSELQRSRRLSLSTSLFSRSRVPGRSGGEKLGEDAEEGAGREAGREEGRGD